MTAATALPAGVSSPAAANPGESPGSAGRPTGRPRPARLSKRTGSLLLPLLLLAALGRPLYPATLEEVPVDHWVYRLIDRLQRRGHFGDLILARRPYTRWQVARYGLYLEAESGRGALDRAERAWAARIRDAFPEEVALAEAKERGGAPGAGQEAGLAASVRDDRTGGEEFAWRVGGAAAARGDLKQDGIELEPPYEDVRTGSAVDPDAAARVEIDGAFQYRNRLFFAEHLKVDSNPINDPAFRIRRSGVRGRHLDFAGAAFGGRYGPVTFLFGRSNLVWGHAGPEALAISATSPAFDLVRYGVGISVIDATGFLAFLDGVRGESGVIHRYLYGHRIDVRPTRRLQFGVGEVALVTGEGRGIEFAYMNPFLSYLLLQKEETVQVNTDIYTTVDGSVFLPGDLFVSAELLVDELFLYRTASNGDFPNQLAFTLEADWSGDRLPPGTTLEVGYTRIGSYVYLHRGEATWYSHYDAPIGDPLGPDGDRWKAGLTTNLLDGLDLGAAFRYRRRGENRLAPGISAEGGRGAPFPLGTVERRREYVVSADCFLTDALVAHGEFTHARITDMNNHAGEGRSVSTLEVSLTWRHEFSGAWSRPGGRAR